MRAHAEGPPPPALPFPPHPPLQLAPPRSPPTRVSHDRWASTSVDTRPGTMLRISVPMFTASWSAMNACGLRRAGGRQAGRMGGLTRCAGAAAPGSSETARAGPPRAALRLRPTTQPAGEPGSQPGSQPAAGGAPRAWREAAAPLLVDGLIQEAGVGGVLHRLEHQAAARVGGCAGDGRRSAQRSRQEAGVRGALHRVEHQAAAGKMRAAAARQLACGLRAATAPRRCKPAGSGTHCRRTAVHALPSSRPVLHLGLVVASMGR